jgi:AraC family transcriptional regulator, activator of mtrCDE
MANVPVREKSAAVTAGEEYGTRDIFRSLQRATAPPAAPSVMYHLHLTFLIADDRNEMPARLITRSQMDDTRDWLSRLLEMIPVRGTLDYRCFLGAPWRIDFATSELGEIPYHVILGGSAVLEDSESGPTRKLIAGDILLFPHGAAHALYDGSDAPPVPARQRSTLATVFHETDGTGDRLDMMCGRFILSTAHDRLMRSYLPRRLILHAPENSAVAGAPGTGAQVVGLVGLMRAESATENLGGLAMLNALSTALFAVALRLASETASPADGLLALAGNPRLAPALTALFNEPARAWTLPELARRCNMSRATFIRHFQERLGRSASDLLTDIRMTVAANALKRSELSTSAVAELAGYQSEAAFQRAFKHQMGLTPAQWRRMGARPAELTFEIHDHSLTGG